jgi:NAD(P)H-hydrate epimerase
MAAYLTRAQVRAIDERAVREYGMPSLLLMENAGRNAAELLAAQGINGKVVICCGKGNNGGDGFVIARHLDRKHIPVEVILLAAASTLQGDARVNYEIVRKSGIPLWEAVPWDAERVTQTLASAAWIVDALFGTGLNNAPAAPYRDLIELINRSPSPVFAVDLPSGLDSDTGLPLGIAVEADVTATFVAKKQGFSVPASQNWTGTVHVLDIGAPRCLIEA